MSPVCFRERLTYLSTVRALDGSAVRRRPSPPRATTSRWPDRASSRAAGHPGSPHLDSLAKNAVAFFRISRSMRSSAFSARSRASSLSCPLTGLRSAGLHGLPSRASRIQFQLMGSWRPARGLCQVNGLGLEIVDIAASCDGCHRNLQLAKGYRLMASVVTGQVQSSVPRATEVIVLRRSVPATSASGHWKQRKPMQFSEAADDCSAASLPAHCRPASPARWRLWG